MISREPWYSISMFTPRSRAKSSRMPLQLLVLRAGEDAQRHISAVVESLLSTGRDRWRRRCCQTMPGHRLSKAMQMPGYMRIKLRVS